MTHPLEVGEYGGAPLVRSRTFDPGSQREGWRSRGPVYATDETGYCAELNSYVYETRPGEYVTAPAELRREQ